MPIEFSEEMNEISGFGGFYERCCRAAVIAGAKWCVDHPHVFEQKAVEEAIRGATVVADDGRRLPLWEELIGTQIAVVLVHIRHIAEHGWNDYVKKMSAPVVVYTNDGSPCESAA